MLNMVEIKALCEISHKDVDANHQLSLLLPELIKAADTGDIEANNIVAKCFMDGRGGLKPNLDEAFARYKLSAEKGDSEGQYSYGICLSIFGEHEKAVEMYMLAVDQKHPGAMQSIGDCYMYGNGISQDTQEAIQWYYHAAQLGDSMASFCLGYCYKVGLGVEQSYSESYKWYKKAETQQGYPLDDQNAREVIDAYENKKPSGGCYIATMVYGSYDAPEVLILRRFRDEVLAKSVSGRLFIQVYYAVSPILVKIFKHSVRINRLIKSVLDKIIVHIKNS